MTASPLTTANLDLLRPRAHVSAWDLTIADWLDQHGVWTRQPDQCAHGDPGAPAAPSAAFVVEDVAGSGWRDGPAARAGRAVVGLRRSGRPASLRAQRVRDGEA